MMENYMGRHSIDGQAHQCGGTLARTSEPGTFRIHGVEIPVDHLFYRCDKCGEELVTEDLAQTVQENALEVFRRQERFWPGEQIRRLRERLRLTQDLVQSALAIGARNFARWENDKVLPGRSMDNLLRLIDRDPSALAYLARIHGAKLPESPIFDESIVDSRKWPRELVSRLQEAAASEGVCPNTYLVMVLADHTTTKSLTVDIEQRVSDGTTAALERFVMNRGEPNNQWSGDDSWNSDHHEVMRQAAAAQKVGRGS